MCRIVIYGCKDVNHISTKGDETVISCNINKRISKTDELTTEIKVSHDVLPKTYQLDFLINTKDFNRKECFVQLESLSEQDIDKVLRVNESVEIIEIDSDATEEYFAVKVEPEESSVSHPMDDKYFVPTIKEEGAESCPMDLVTIPIEKPTNKKIDIEIPESGFEYYMCDYCSCVYFKRGEIKRHVKTHIKKSYKCNECSETFLTESALTDHQRTHLRFQCEICGKLFPNKGSLGDLNKHMSVHKKTLCPICGKPVNQKHLKEHKETHQARDDRQLYGCSMCDKKYVDSYGLRRHSKTHTGEMNRDQTFAHKVHAQDSVNHAGNLHECSMCDKKFSSLSNLQDHLTNHTNEMKCDYCGKSFGRKDHVRRHMALHTKYNQYDGPLNFRELQKKSQKSNENNNPNVP